MMPDLYIPKSGPSNSDRVDMTNRLVAEVMREQYGSLATITPPTQQGLTMDEMLSYQLKQAGSAGTWKTAPVDEYLGSEY
jgi:hypothetical protein